MAITKHTEQVRNTQLLEDLEVARETTSETRSFDPARHVVRLRNGDYLEVKWRLLWLRNVHPNAHIETEMIHFDPDNKLAVFKAQITLPDGGSATGWGSETSDDFKDFIEKAETKAIGRACAALGFGTQHCLDFDYDSQSQGRVVDAPVSYASNNNSNPGRVMDAQASYSTQRVPTRSNDSGAVSVTLATDKQVKFIYGTGKAQGLSDEQIVALCREKFGVVPEELTRSSASRFIDMLKQPA